MSINPIFYHSGGRIQDADVPSPTTPVEPAGWYFWTETWADYIGPFKTYDDAVFKIKLYAEQL